MIVSHGISLLVTAAAVFVALTTSSVALGLATIPRNIRFRNGRKGDEWKIATTLAKELMNPLGVRAERFVVATDMSASNINQPIGWAQIKPLGTQAVDPNVFDAVPGSYDLERDVDDAMWDEFEKDDSIQIPSGFASLPWSKEYRQMESSIQNRQQRREEIRNEFMQDMETFQLYELSSVYVEKQYRGKGIGTELVRRIIRRTLQLPSSSTTKTTATTPKTTDPSHLYCLTLATTSDWYKQNFGFEIVPLEDTQKIPKSLALEITAGNLITKMIGAQLVCMQGTTKTLELCCPGPGTPITTGTT